MSGTFSPVPKPGSSLSAKLHRLRANVLSESRSLLHSRGEMAAVVALNYRFTCPSVTFQCPPLSGPTRVNLPADLNSRVARSMVRSDFPSRVATSGIESSGFSLSNCRTFPDVFPDVFPDITPDIFLNRLAESLPSRLKSISNRV